MTNGCGDTGARETPVQNQIIPGDPQVTPVQSPPPASTQDWISKDPPHADLRSTARCLNEERMICNLNHGFGTNLSPPPGSIGSLWPLCVVLVHSGESHAHLGSGYISVYRPRMRNFWYSLNAQRGYGELTFAARRYLYVTLRPRAISPDTCGWKSPYATGALAAIE